MQKKKRLPKKEKGVESRNEYLHWLQEYKDEKKKSEEKKMDLVTSLNLRFLLLKLLSDKNTIFCVSFFKTSSTTNKSITCESQIARCKAKHAVLQSRDFQWYFN